MNWHVKGTFSWNFLLPSSWNGDLNKITRRWLFFFLISVFVPALWSLISPITANHTEQLMTLWSTINANIQSFCCHMFCLIYVWTCVISLFQSESFTSVAPHCSDATFLLYFINLMIKVEPFCPCRWCWIPNWLPPWCPTSQIKLQTAEDMMLRCKDQPLWLWVSTFGCDQNVGVFDDKTSSVKQDLTLKHNNNC